MVSTKYTYSIQNNFPNHKVSTDRLLCEIRCSTIITATDYINTSNDDCDIWFKDQLNNDDKSILDNLISIHTGDPSTNSQCEPDGTPIVALKSQQSDGIPIFAQAARVGDEWVIGSHNFCDPCSWFGDSIRINNEILIDNGDNLTFNSSNINWVDMISGRVHNDIIWVEIQQAFNPNDPHGYQVIISVDGYQKTMREPFETSGGDYEVLWEEGKILFYEPQTGVVTASYNYSTTNTFYVRPSAPGKVLILEDVETDMSVDVVMTDAISYSAWYFDGTQMVKEIEYTFKRANQILTEARGCYPVFTAMGATSDDMKLELKEFRRKCRGMKFARQSIPFQYATAREIPSYCNAEIRVNTQHNNRAYQGETVTMTFYCTEKDE